MPDLTIPMGLAKAGKPPLHKDLALAELNERKAKRQALATRDADAYKMFKDKFTFKPEDLQNLHKFQQTELMNMGSNYMKEVLDLYKANPNDNMIAITQKLNELMAFKEDLHDEYEKDTEMKEMEGKTMEQTDYVNNIFNSGYQDRQAYEDARNRTDPLGFFGRDPDTGVPFMVSIMSDEAVRDQIIANEEADRGIIPSLIKASGVPGSEKQELITTLKTMPDSPEEAKRLRQEYFDRFTGAWENVEDVPIADKQTYLQGRYGIDPNLQNWAKYKAHQASNLQRLLTPQEQEDFFVGATRQIMPTEVTEQIRSKGGDGGFQINVGGKSDPATMKGLGIEMGGEVELGQYEFEDPETNESTIRKIKAPVDSSVRFNLTSTIITPGKDVRSNTGEILDTEGANIKFEGDVFKNIPFWKDGVKAEDVKQNIFIAPVTGDLSGRAVDDALYNVNKKFIEWKLVSPGIAEWDTPDGTEKSSVYVDASIITDPFIEDISSNAEKEWKKQSMQAMRNRTKYLNDNLKSGTPSKATSKKRSGISW